MQDKAYQRDYYARSRGFGSAADLDAHRADKRIATRERAKVKAKERYQANREKMIAESRAWALANPERAKTLQQRWRQDNPDRCNELAREWRQENPDRYREIQKASRHKNADKVNARERRYYAEQQAEDPDRKAREIREWRAKNPGRARAIAAARRARVLRVTPPWADQDALRQVYDVAAMLGMEVDHVHPLKGKNFCGLHVPWNLQLLTRSENASKGNKLPAGPSVFD